MDKEELGSERMKGLLKNWLHSSGRDIIYIKGFSKIIPHLKSRELLMLSFAEAQNLINLSESTSKLSGAIAEVGTYTGGSTILLNEHLGKREIFTFDTFEGLPSPTSLDGKEHFFRGQYIANFMNVFNLLHEVNPNINVIRGMFEDKTHIISHKTFSLVHLDVDLYQTTVLHNKSWLHKK